MIILQGIFKLHSTVYWYIKLLQIVICNAEYIKRIDSKLNIFHVIFFVVLFKNLVRIKIINV